MNQTKSLIDKLVVYLVGKFGYPDEAIEQDREIMKLKKALIEEKMKRSTDMETELVELRTKVETMQDEKVYMLEQEINRLKFENEKLMQLPPPTYEQERDALNSKTPVADYVNSTVISRALGVPRHGEVHGQYQDNDAGDNK